MIDGRIFNSAQDALLQLHSIQKLNRKIVFTNGCFDILHPGHISYLREAKRLGDVLVVGLNSDESVKRLKGPTRPILNQDERATLIVALEMVDLVIIFDEDTPIETIETIKPDIHVKGGDYKAKDLPEYPIVKTYGGDVKILRFIDGQSTSGIIERIQKH
jgi:rfaE bifunctional protein nucleotidyltransferase chain/domain